jgi:heme-degrading monooxygenase HmoA
MTWVASRVSPASGSCAAAGGTLGAGFGVLDDVRAGLGAAEDDGCVAVGCVVLDCVGEAERVLERGAADVVLDCSGVEVCVSVGDDAIEVDEVTDGVGVSAASDDVCREPTYSRAVTPRTAAVAAVPRTVANRITLESASIRAMVLEVALIDVLPGTAEKFEAAFHEVKHAVLASPGLLSLRMTHGVENPDRFVLLIEWESVEAHDKGFRETDRFAVWRGGIGPYFANPPLVQHYVDVEEGGV